MVNGTETTADGQAAEYGFLAKTQPLGVDSDNILALGQNLSGFRLVRFFGITSLLSGRRLLGIFGNYQWTKQLSARAGSGGSDFSRDFSYQTNSVSS